jgi:predicted branched-subunit amino acid permease
MHHVPNARSEFAAGVRAFMPLTMAIIPLGMVCGAAAVAAGMTAWQAFSMGWVIFAGSAQIVLVQLNSSGAPLAVIIATATLINLRFMMYSASLGPQLGALGKPWRMLLAYLITDQAAVLGIMRYMEPGDRRCRHWYLLGVSGATWLCWQLSSLLGIVLGSLMPQDWSLDFILPLTFISIIVPLLSNRAMLLAGIAGGAAAVLLILPLRLNLIAATLIGVGAGLLAERLGWNK